MNLHIQNGFKLEQSKLDKWFYPPTPGLAGNASRWAAGNRIFSRLILHLPPPQRGKTAHT
jgi:hypothetical protein